MDFHKEVDGVAGFYMHDPVAVGVAIDPELVQTEEIYVQVETEGKITSGMTVGDFRPVRRYKSKPNVRVCTKVNADKFLTLFLDAVK